MIHHVHPAPVALLAARIQGEPADVGLKFLPAIRALLQGASFLSGLWDNLLRDEMKFI